MDRSRFLQRIFLLWAVALLIGCGAPTAAPTAPPSLPPPPAPPEVQITFSADRNELKPGECALLRWSVLGGFGVDIDGEPVDRSGERPVCPPETTSYTLAVDTGVTIATRQVVILVSGQEQAQQPPPQPPPPAEIAAGQWVQEPPPPPPPPSPWPETTEAVVVEEVLPDLAVVALGSLPEAPRAGEELVLTAVVRNQGDGDATDFFVSFFLDEGSAGSQLVDRLPAGTELVIQARAAPLSAGTHTLKVVADAERWHPDRDRGNDELSKGLTVPEAVLPDPAVEGLTVSPESPAPGQVVTIRATIWNRGTGAAERVEAALSIMDLGILEELAQGECSPDRRWAVEVVGSAPGAGANPELVNPSAALGPPDFSDEPARGFVNLGIDGSITVAFGENRLMDGPGDDLRIWGRPGQDQSFYVEISEDGALFLPLGLVRAGAELDIGETHLKVAGFVRITDDGSREQEGTPFPGGDVDAVEALRCLPLGQEPIRLDKVEVLPFIEPGGRQTVTVSWTPAAAGDYTLVVEVDALDSLRESDESNNRIEQLVTVKAK